MIKPYVFDGALLTATAVIQGTAVPANTTRLVKSMSVTNTTASPVTLAVYFVPMGGTANAVSTVISGKVVAANETYTPDLGTQGVNPGGSIQASGAGLTFRYTALDFT